MDKMVLTKKEKRWILYDVANSAFIMLVSTVIPIYFKNMAEDMGIVSTDATAYWGYALTIATIIVAILGPTLGAIADTKGYKKPLFTFFMLMGALGCAALSVPRIPLLFLIVFVVAKVAFNGSLIFYDAMLTDVSADDRMDYVSSQGYAWGYIGSCIPFTISLAIILLADKIGISGTTAMVIAFLLNAIWWFCLTLPLLKSYEQVYYVEKGERPVASSFKRLFHVGGEIKQNKKVLLFLLAFFFYIDGVYTIIEMATSYGKDVGIDDNQLLGALLLTQIVAFPAAIFFGKLARKVKADYLLMVCIGAYAGIALFALQLDRAYEFWILAVCVALFQGAIQALSRSYYAKIIPKDRSSEYFGVFDIFGKGASALGVLLLSITAQLFASSKAGIVALIFMFIIGFVLFWKQSKLAGSVD